MSVPSNEKNYLMTKAMRIDPCQLYSLIKVYNFGDRMFMVIAPDEAFFFHQKKWIFFLSVYKKYMLRELIRHTSLWCF